MKIAEINTVSHGSTGKIASNIIKLLELQGNTAYLCIPNGRHNKLPYNGKHIWIGGRISEDLHIILSRLTGWNGVFSIAATLKFIKKLDSIHPDVIHLHNLHNAYINLPILFRYIKNKRIPVIWTLHDCWPFTGHCPHFDIVQCDKWKTSCHHCPQYKEYPQSFLDNSKKMYTCKKKWFTGVANLTIVTPSQWLADLVKQSFLKEYPVRVINNGIDLDIFQPIEGNFREKYAISPDKHIVLGVAFGWDVRKGLDVFIELSKRFDKRYQIILVGTDDNIDKKLPNNIISIHRTHNQKELAEIYTAADVLANPTREDTFPTVNIESIACGTPVVTFKTGGSPEILDKTSGSVVEREDIDAMEAEIVRICENKPYSKEDCLKRAAGFDKDKKFQEYIDLFHENRNKV